MGLEDLYMYEEELRRKAERIAARRAAQKAETEAREAGEAQVLDVFYNVHHPDPIKQPGSTGMSESKVTVKNVEVVLPNDEEFPDEDEEVDAQNLEELLTNAVLLLRDMNNLCITLTDPLINGRLTVYMQGECRRFAEEVSEFLKDCDTGEVSRPPIFDRDAKIYD